MTKSILDQLEIFHGQANANVARVYARLDCELGPPCENLRWQLTGHVRGPHSTIATTLPSHVPLRPMSEGAEGRSPIIAQAVVLDPCFWSPDSPSLYRIEVALHDGQRTLDQQTRWFGIRHFGTRGRDIILDGKRWVVRAAARRSVPTTPIRAWREHRMTMWVDTIDEKLFDEASKTGVMLIVHLKGDLNRIQTCLNRLRHWACAAMVVVDAEEEMSGLTRQAPNVVLLQLSSGNTDLSLAPWAHGVICNVKDEPCCFGDWNVPVIVVRDSTSHVDLASARIACDLLQRDLAQRRQCAGYIVA